jgi:exopolysaccharide biosynthesis protein
MKRGGAFLLKKWLRACARKIIIVLALVCCLLLPQQADAYQLLSQSSTQEILTRGAVLQSIHLQTNEGLINAYVIKADLTDPYLKIDTIVGANGTLDKNQAVSAMAVRAGAVAAINGDFFQMKDSGRPIGLLYQGGSLITSPAQRTDMYGFGLTADKTPIIDIFGFTGQVKAKNGKTFPLAGTNKPGYLLMSEASSDSESLTMYTPLWGSVSRGKLPSLSGVVEVVVQKGVVKQVLTDQPGVPVPSGGYILKGHGQAAKFLLENLPVGSSVEVSSSVFPDGEKLFAALGGQALLVENGQLPPYFSQNISGNHSRTAAGISQDGKTLFLVAVEKALGQNSSVLSRGMSQEELAAYLISQGVWRAVNLDGGGSTTLAARHPGEFKPVLVNQPQGGTQRLVPDALGVFSKAPAGPLAGLLLSGTQTLLAGTRGSYAASGYDTYFNPVLVDPGQVAWRSGAGDFLGSVFLARQGGTVKVEAQVGNVQGSMDVRVIGPESLTKLLVAPAKAELGFGETAAFKVEVKTVQGESFALAPKDVAWKVNGAIGSIVDGKFTAAGAPATGEIIVDFQGLTVSVPVSVRLPAKEAGLTPDNPAVIELEDGIKLQFPQGSVSQPVQMSLAIAVPEGLPAGFDSLQAFDLKPAGGGDLELAVPWRLTWQQEGVDQDGRPAVLTWDEKASRWRELPSAMVDIGQEKALLSKSWRSGKLVLALDRRPAPAFTDTSAHWARRQIANLAAGGVVNGFPDGTFGPDQRLTRAQFAVLLQNALQWSSPAKVPTFKDTVPQWAESAVAAANARGVVKGYPDGRFAPDDSITRSEMATVITRALSLPAGESTVRYNDAAAIPEFAVTSVGAVTATGIMQGGDGMFRPRDGASRAEAAAVVDRLLKWWLEH